MFKFIILFIYFATALNATLTLDDATKKYDNFSIKYLHDENSALTIDDIENTEFEQEIPNQFTQGYLYGDAWFKLEFTNNSRNKDFVLYFTEPFWNTVDFYSKEDGSWKVQKNGLYVPLKERLIDDHNPAFILDIPINTTTTYYVKAQTVSGHIGEFQLFTHDEYFRPSRFTISEFFIVYHFILLSVLILNFYNFCMTRERLYGYYIIYIFSFILFSSVKGGTYLSLGIPGYQHGLHVVGATVVLFLLLFSMTFLEIKKRLPFIYTIFKLSALLITLFIILIALDVPYVTLIFNIYSSFFFTLLLFVAFKVWFQGFDIAKYYLIALMIFMPTMGLMTMNFNTILANTDITRYAYLFGALLEIIFFTLILTHRYLDANEEKCAIQDALIEEKENNEKRLLSKIEKKTKSLLKANKHLTEKTEELERTKEQLTKEATIDVLSGLHNRRYFFEAAHKCFYRTIRYEQELSVVMIDIDKFKHINDTFGHVFGDRVIRVISNILKDMIRESDILARYGGEEFIILLSQTPINEALLLAQRIREEIEKKEITSDEEMPFKVTVSIGITQVSKEEDTDIEQLILRADEALYNAKNAGRNRVSSL